MQATTPIFSHTDPQAYTTWLTMWQRLDTFPMRFTYDGRVHQGLGGLPLLEKQTAQTPEKQTVTLRLALDDSIILRVETAYWTDFGAREWTVYFENTGTAPSATLSDLVSIDLFFAGDAPLVRGILGDHENLYRPYCHELSAAPLHFCNNIGRPTHETFPYFDLVCGDKGCLAALGWGGTWSAAFTAADNGLRFEGRVCNGLCGPLKPGERVCAGLMALLPYRGRDAAAAANLWRAWYVACNLPREADGTPLRPFSTVCLANDTGLPNSDGSISENHTTWRPSLERMAAEGVHADVRWVDAGWYLSPTGESLAVDWPLTGSWQMDPAKWPEDSFGQATQYARDHGMKTMLWFEPERLTDPASLAKNYGYDPAWALPQGTMYVNNIGDPACFAWTLGRILKVLGENRIEIYREDNNIDSAASWRLGDEMENEGRTGFTENRTVMAHYALWDAIIAFQAAHGGAAWVDSCASGGGRNDLASMRRGVPLLRSDSDRTSTSLRLSMTWALNSWLPFCGSCTDEKAGQLDGDGAHDLYIWRASYLPALHIAARWAQQPNDDFSVIRAGVREWETVRPYLLKEFYPLTPWHPQEDRTGWTAFAWFDGETGKGVLQAFRMEDCPDADCTLQLPFIGEGARCRLRDADTGAERTIGGDAFTVTLPAPRSAALYYMEVLPQQDDGL